MSFLKDVFQTADEIKQSQEKLKDAVDASSRQAAALVRPYLGEVQNETLSDILEGLVASVAEHSFQIGYSSAMQTFAEAAVALEAGSHVQQKNKNRLTCGNRQSGCRDGNICVCAFPPL